MRHGRKEACLISFPRCDEGLNPGAAVGTRLTACVCVCDGTDLYVLVHIFLHPLAMPVFVLLFELGICKLNEYSTYMMALAVNALFTFHYVLLCLSCLTLSISLLHTAEFIFISKKKFSTALILFFLFLYIFF